MSAGRVFVHIYWYVSVNLYIFPSETDRGDNQTELAAVGRYTAGIPYTVQPPKGNKGNYHNLASCLPKHYHHYSTVASAMIIIVLVQQGSIVNTITLEFAWRLSDFLSFKMFMQLIVYTHLAFITLFINECNFNSVNTVYMYIYIYVVIVGWRNDIGRF